LLSYMDFKQFPKDKGKMLAEIKRAFDAYDNDNIEDKDFIDLISHYQSYSEEEQWIGRYDSIDGFQIKQTTAVKLGQSRSKRLVKILNKIAEFDM
jgi:hypothetical protein